MATLSFIAKDFTRRSPTGLFLLKKDSLKANYFIFNWEDSEARAKDSQLLEV